ncbi:hypothetical protein HWV62_28878 [Athelia sp. TMB]|nr:hypothetical protein HWV62_28878 [Athelia sp. TMB]
MSSKPPFPYISKLKSPLPDGVTGRIESFLIKPEELPSDFTYALERDSLGLHFPYFYYSGSGAPSLTIGCSGDLYRDDDKKWIYYRHVDEWKLWPGPPTSQPHPYLPGYVLWSMDSTVRCGWRALGEVESAALAARMSMEEGEIIPELREKADVHVASTRVEAGVPIETPYAGASPALSSWNGKPLPMENETALSVLQSTHTALQETHNSLRTTHKDLLNEHASVKAAQVTGIQLNAKLTIELTETKEDLARKNQEFELSRHAFQEEKNDMEVKLGTLSSSLDEKTAQVQQIESELSKYLASPLRTHKPIPDLDYLGQSKQSMEDLEATHNAALESRDQELAALKLAHNAQDEQIATLVKCKCDLEAQVTEISTTSQTRLDGASTLQQKLERQVAALAKSSDTTSDVMPTLSSYRIQLPQPAHLPSSLELPATNQALGADESQHERLRLTTPANKPRPVLPPPLQIVNTSIATPPQTPALKPAAGAFAPAQADPLAKIVAQLPRPTSPKPLGSDPTKSPRSIASPIDEVQAASISTPPSRHLPKNAMPSTLISTLGQTHGHTSSTTTSTPPPGPDAAPALVSRLEDVSERNNSALQQTGTPSAPMSPLQLTTRAPAAPGPLSTRTTGSSTPAKSAGKTSITPNLQKTAALLQEASQAKKVSPAQTRPSTAHTALISANATPNSGASACSPAPTASQQAIRTTLVSSTSTPPSRRTSLGSPESVSTPWKPSKLRAAMQGVGKNHPQTPQIVSPLASSANASIATRSPADLIVGGHLPVAPALTLQMKERRPGDFSSPPSKRPKLSQPTAASVTSNGQRPTKAQVSPTRQKMTPSTTTSSSPSHMSTSRTLPKASNSSSQVDFPLPSLSQKLSTASSGPTANASSSASSSSRAPVSTDTEHTRTSAKSKSPDTATDSDSPAAPLAAASAVASHVPSAPAASAIPGTKEDASVKREAVEQRDALGERKRKRVDSSGENTSAREGSKRGKEIGREVIDLTLSSDEEEAVAPPKKVKGKNKADAQTIPDQPTPSHPFGTEPVLSDVPVKTEPAAAPMLKRKHILPFVIKSNLRASKRADRPVAIERALIHVTDRDKAATPPVKIVVDDTEAALQHFAVAHALIVTELLKKSDSELVQLLLDRRNRRKDKANTNASAQH